MNIWKAMKRDDLEQLVFCQDRESGLQAVIALHSTRLGPALGGCRMWAYPSEKEAVRDAIRLARAMSYKCAISGLPYGGGKAVIWSQPDTDRKAQALRMLGRFIEGLHGQYISGLDLGTSVADMDMIRMETSHVTDTSGSLGATNDFTAEMTAYGVMLGIQAALKQLDGSDRLAHRSITIQGLGKVGYFLCRYLSKAGAEITVCDIDPGRVKRVMEQFGARAAAVEHIYDTSCDVFAPCALGGILNSHTIPRLRCRVIAGAANNQLAAGRYGHMLHKLGILYAPDYVINAGGIIVTAAELNGDNAAMAKKQVEHIRHTLSLVFQYARLHRISSAVAADRLTRQRLGL
ncbi:Leu/Phe/Val dehydrogenase [Paenibacillus sp. y28]|uniref:Leu/Phe/Val dehydrogenase n=1 Tax=Paenibacillus sp. y28 TaxID=3129110 RepID=UPI003019AEBE